MYIQNCGCMYDKRFHNEKHNVKASIAVGLPGLFSPSEWNNVEASKRINVATESITDRGGKQNGNDDSMSNYPSNSNKYRNLGNLIPECNCFTSSSYRICERIAKKTSCDFSVWYASDLWSSCAWSSEGILVKSAFSVTCRWHAASCCQVWTLSEGSALVKLRNLHGIQPRICQLWTALGHFGQGNPCAFLIHVISFDNIFCVFLCIMLGKVPQTNLRRSLCFGAPNVSVPRPNHPRRKLARCGQVP